MSSGMSRVRRWPLLLGLLALAASSAVISLVVVISAGRWNAEGWTAVGAVAASAQALGVLAALWYAAGQLHEARTLRERQDRPFVVIDFDVQTIPAVVLIEISNLGPVLARDVTFSFDPPLQAAVDSTPGHDPADFIKQTFSTIVPGARIVTVFDFTPERRQKLKDPAFPWTYEVTVRCSDENGKKFTNTYTLDLRPYRTRMYIDRKTTHDVAKELTALRKELRQLATAVFKRDYKG